MGEKPGIREKMALNISRMIKHGADPKFAEKKTREIVRKQDKEGRLKSPKS